MVVSENLIVLVDKMSSESTPTPAVDTAPTATAKFFDSKIWCRMLDFLHFADLFACYTSCKKVKLVIDTNDERIFAHRVMRKFADKNLATSYFLSHVGHSFDLKMGKIFTHVAKYYTYEVPFKILLHGPAQTGKSCFLAAFMENQANAKPAQMPAAIDFVRC